MPRRVEDIIQTGKRSIRDVPVDIERAPSAPRPRAARPGSSASEADRQEAPRPRAREEKPEEVKINRIRVMPPPEEPPKRPRRPSRPRASGGSGRGAKMWSAIVGGVILSVALAAFVASSYFSRATFTIAPITVPISTSDATIVALAAPTQGYLHYVALETKGVASSTVPAKDGPYISSKATGTVTVYNAYSSSPQRIIAGSRLAGSNGLVYRTTRSIVIPGYTYSKGSKIPGSYRVSVVADQPGSQYDASASDMGDLKFIAYMTTARYDAVYAKPYTGMTGGFVGHKKTIDPGTLSSTTAGLKSTIAATLLAKAKSLVPDGFIMYDTAYTISYGDPVITDTSADMATISIPATLYSIVFKESDLVAKLAGSKLGSLADAPYTADGLDKLDFAITNASTFDPSKGTALIAKVSGNITVKGVVPVDELKQKLAGLPLADTKSVISSYSSVIDQSKSSGELFPAWATTVPKDPNRISIVVKD